MEEVMHHTENKDLHSCITICWECRTECQETLFNHCFEMGGKHVEAEHIRLMADCIQICQTAADSMTRGSEAYLAICNACAEVCDACAVSCDKIGDEKMKRCAELCRRCAKSCREMAQMKKAA